ncbi:MAG: LEPR-XLL domain-containing protein, partial [Planctomycetota bacterium]
MRNSTNRNNRAGDGPHGVRFEPLETRVLLSGDVIAMVSDEGNLIITGDSQGNAILIEMAGTAAGEVQVTSADGSTTINGQVGPVILSGVTGDVEAEMGKGADSVTFNVAYLPGGLMVDGGDGDTAVTLSMSQVAGDLFVTGRRGNATVGLYLSGVSGQVGVQHGNGDVSVTTVMSSIGQSLQVLGRKGYERVYLGSYVTIGGDVDLQLRGGGSEVTLFQAYLGGRLSIQANRGADLVQLNTATVAGDIYIDTGDDADDIDVMDLTAGAGVTINTGRGNDAVDIETAGLPFGLRTTIAGLLDIDTS